MKEHCISLIFDSKSQRLKLIQVDDLSKVKLSYGNTIFTGDHEATLERIYNQIFGPTYPGKYSTEYKKGGYYYLLSYPGLTFIISIPKDKYLAYEKKLEIPIEFPDQTTPIATELLIYKGHDYQNPILPPIPEKEKLIYFEEVYVTLGKGIQFKERKKNVFIKDTPQDVMSELGSPDQIFYKKHDKLKIHTNQIDDENNDHPNAIDYFFNYFSLGIDIMFDGSTHTVQKIIMRTNFPGSKDFNVYKKCNYQIKIKNQTITPSDKFDSIHQLLGDGAKPLINANSPFGKTWYYAYENCIFEVLQNQYVNSLTIF